MAAGCVAVACVAGCASPPAQEPPRPAPVVDAAPPLPAILVIAPPAPVAATNESLNAAFAYADRVRTLPAAELAAEIARLGEPGDAPVRLMQTALALNQTRVPANAQRAQALLQRVLAIDTPESRPLHPLARMLTAQYAESRRMEEQLEKSSQQVRDGQRRIDQLNERLEAVRAIERSLPSRSTSGINGNGAAPNPR